MRNFSIYLKVRQRRQRKGNLSLLPTTTYAPHQFGTCQHVSVMPRGTRVALASLPVAGGVATYRRRHRGHQYVRSAHIAVV